MIERSAEVLPERGVRARVVCGKQQDQHVNESEEAGGANEDSRDERQTDTQLTIRNEECNRRGMWQNEILQDRLHEGICAIFKKAVDPKLKSSMKRELRAKNLVFTEN